MPADPVRTLAGTAVAVLGALQPLYLRRLSMGVYPGHLFGLLIFDQITRKIGTPDLRNFANMPPEDRAKTLLQSAEQPK